MIIAVSATDKQWEELINDALLQVCKRMDVDGAPVENADAFLVLKEDDNIRFYTYEKPVLFNSVTNTLSELNLSPNIIRFNGWQSFISRDSWEIAGSVNDSLEQVMKGLGKKIIVVPDEPGFVSARIISMIINEAYFALGDNVSTKQEIDVAMKLGTNYPYGPFEWASIIGVKKIFTLLQKLSESDKRYIPAPLLKEEVVA